jgi:hypothetical protein
MQALRDAVVAMRKKVSGGFLSWRSIGGRLLWLLIAIISCMTWWIVRDWRETDRLARTAERPLALVTERFGKNGLDANKYITVQFTLQSGQVTTARVAEFLSQENWDKAEPGAQVPVFHDASTGRTYLQADIERWNRDKKWIPLLPIGIAVPIVVICICLSSYRVGVHDDGREYLVYEDYVTADDREALVDRTSYNLGRALWWLAR